MLYYSEYDRHTFNRWPVNLYYRTLPSFQAEEAFCPDACQSRCKPEFRKLFGRNTFIKKVMFGMMYRTSIYHFHFFAKS